MTAVREVSGLTWTEQYDLPAMEWLPYVQYYNFRKARERKEIEKIRRQAKSKR